MAVRVTPLVHAEDGHMAPEPGDLMGQAVTGRNAPPEPAHTGPCLADQAGHPGLGDSKLPLDLHPAPEPAGPQDSNQPFKLFHRAPA